jgi:hypothetical protein
MMPEQYPPKKKRVDRTHDPKPNSGWWDDPHGHRIAAMKNNSRGGLGSKIHNNVLRGPGNERKAVRHVISSTGRRSK